MDWLAKEINPPGRWFIGYAAPKRQSCYFSGHMCRKISLVFRIPFVLYISSFQLQTIFGFIIPLWVRISFTIQFGQRLKASRE
jgi:hypothetical protein